MELKINGKLLGHLKKAWVMEYPEGNLPFEMWCVAVLANAAAKIIQQATTREIYDSLKEDTDAPETETAN
jgi:hypothetical protein